MIKIKSLLFLLFISVYAQHGLFVENKGQWPKEVQYASQVNSVQWIYILSNEWRFAIKDPKVWEATIGQHGKNNSKAWPEKIDQLALFYQFKNANYDDLKTEEQATSYSNYFLGKDMKVGKALEFKHLFYSNLYPNIDARLKQEHGNFKYDLILNPGADISNIQLHVEGADIIKIGKRKISYKSTVISLDEILPKAYQLLEGKEVEVEVNYVLNSENVLGFEIGQYDPSYPVVIDPVLVMATYSGSTADNFGYTATFDKAGHLYSGSTILGAVGTYPTTPGAFSTSYGGDLSDIAITKYALDGSSRIYSTYLGGNGSELPHSIIVNDFDELYVFGTTSSTNFPRLVDSWDTTFAGGSFLDLRQGLGMWFINGSDIFVSRFNASGTALLGSTYIGGSQNDGINRTVAGGVATNNTLKYNYADEVRGEIVLDRNNNVYVATCTRSADFPIDTLSFQPNFKGVLDGVIFKFDQGLNNLIWSSYLGGAKEDALYDVTFDSNNDLIVTGGTQTDSLYTDTNTVNPYYQGGRSDGFVTKIKQDGRSISQFTYWGGNDYDQSYFVELDRYGNIHLFGQTENIGTDMINNAIYNTPNAGQFLVKLTPDLDSVIWSTTFGTGAGRPNISPTSFLVDYCSKIYLAGWGGAVNSSLTGDNNSQSVTNMDITPGAQQSTTDGSDFYIMVIEDDASALDYATFFGGNISAEHVDGGTSRFDRSGKIYQSVCAGCGSNDDFPTTPGAVSSTNNAVKGGFCNNGVFKFDFELPVVIADFLVDPLICIPQSISPQNLSVNATNFFWDFGDGTTSNLEQPNHTYTTAGTYEIILVADNSLTCNFNDTIKRTITVLSSSSRSEDTILVCLGETIQLGFSSNNNAVNYLWTPATGLSSNTVSNPFVTPTNDIVYTLEIDAGICVDTISYPIDVSDVNFTVGPDTSFCSGNYTLDFKVEQGHIDGTHYTWSTNPQFTNPISTGINNTLINYSFSSSQNIYVRGTYKGCESIDTIQLYVGTGFVDIDYTPFICFNDTSLTTVVPFENQYTYQYNWLSNQNIITNTTQDSAWMFPNPGQDYILQTYIVELNCYVFDTISIQMSQLDSSLIQFNPTSDTIYQGASSYISYTPINYPINLTPNNTVDQINNGQIIVSPEQTTTYQVNYTDQSCVFTRRFEVVVLEFICGPPNIEVPNAFTPNGDGINDQAVVLGNVIEKLDFNIYDRWGNLMFKTNNINEGWDGTYKGREVDPAVYVYYAEGTCVNGDEYLLKGNITLIK